MKTAARPQTRWMVRSDLDECVGIAAECFERPWTQDEWLRALRRRDCVARVTQGGKQLAGFLAYQFSDHEYRLLQLAVAPCYRSMGYGTALVNSLIFGDNGVDKLCREGRRRVVAHVPERLSPALEFFKALHFKARGWSGGDVVMRRMYWE